jgi:hypothetical protein
MWKPPRTTDTYQVTRPIETALCYDMIAFNSTIDGDTQLPKEADIVLGGHTEGALRYQPTITTLSRCTHTIKASAMKRTE